MSIVVDTPDGIAHFQMLSIRGRLQLEQKGIRFRLPTLKAANRIYGTNFSRRQQMIDYLNTKIEEATNGTASSSPSSIPAEQAGTPTRPHTSEHSHSYAGPDPYHDHPDDDTL